MSFEETLNMGLYSEAPYLSTIDHRSINNIEKGDRSSQAGYLIIENQARARYRDLILL